MLDLVGKSKVVHALDVKYILPADRIIIKLPHYQSFGRQFNLRLDLQYMPNLKWEPTVKVKTNFTAVTSK